MHVHRDFFSLSLDDSLKGVSQKWEDCLEHKCLGESEDVHSTSSSLPPCLLISFFSPMWGVVTVREGEEGPGFSGVGTPYRTSLPSCAASPAQAQ